jgi:hypothetical protein
MRSKLFFLALACVTAAHAQQPAPQAKPQDVPVAPAPAAAPDLVTLSDVAKQASAEAKAAPSQPALAEVPAITPVDGNAALEATRARLRAAADRQAEPASVMLTRISSVDGDMRAVVWVKGQHRRLAPGAHLLQYTVGEIRNDGVCLYTAKAGGRTKDYCPKLLTFAQGVM